MVGNLILHSSIVDCDNETKRRNVMTYKQTEMCTGCKNLEQVVDLNELSLCQDCKDNYFECDICYQLADKSDYDMKSRTCNQCIARTMPNKRSKRYGN